MSGKYPNIGKPVVTLYYDSKKIVDSKTGPAPSSTSTNCSVTFNVKGKITPSQINNPSKFKVVINYPSNANNYAGTILLGWVKVTTTYITPSYILGHELLTSDVRKNSTFDIKFNIQSNNTSYNPSPTITLPDNIQYYGKVNGDGEINQVGNTLNWNPGLNSSKSQSVITLRFVGKTVAESTYGYSCNTPSFKKSLNGLVNINYPLLNLLISEPEAYNIKDNESINWDLEVNCTEYFDNTDPIHISLNGNFGDVSFNNSSPLKLLGEYCKINLGSFNSNTSETSTGFSIKRMANSPYKIIFKADPNTEYGLFYDGHFVVSSKTDDSGDGELSWIGSGYTTSNTAIILEIESDEVEDKWVTYEWIPKLNNSTLNTILNAVISVDLPQNKYNGVIKYKIGYNNVVNTYNYKIYPSNITKTYYDYIILNQEELDRLGEDVNYEVSSYLQVVEDDADGMIPLNQEEFSKDNFTTSQYEPVGSIDLFNFDINHAIMDTNFSISEMENINKSYSISFNGLSEVTYNLFIRDELICSSKTDDSGDGEFTWVNEDDIYQRLETASISYGGFECLNANFTGQLGNSDLSLKVNKESFEGKIFSIKDNNGNILSQATCTDGEVFLNWSPKDWSEYDYGYVTLNSIYEEEIPDYLINHRLGVYHNDPQVVLEDGTGYNSNWINSGFIVSKDDITRLTPNQSNSSYINEYILPSSWSISFTHEPNMREIDGELVFDDDYENKGIIIGDTFLKFSNIGVKNTTCNVTIEYTEEFLIVSIDGDEYCLFDDYTHTSNSKFKFVSTGSEINFYNFRIKNLNELSITEKIRIAYQNCTWGTRVTEHNKWTLSTVIFNYNPKYPVIIFHSGEPTNNGFNPQLVKLKHTNPCVQEEDESNTFLLSGNYPQPILNIIDDDSNDIATVNGLSEQIILYDFEDLESFSTEDDLAVQGVSLEFETPHQEDTTILASLKLNEKIGNRSAIITSDTENNILIGDEFDKWGLKFNDFLNLEHLEILLQHNGANIFSINNPSIHINYEKINETNINCLVGGDDETDPENLSYYGAFLKNVNIPGGINTNTEYLNVTGTDTNEAYRMNVKEKEIELEFQIDGCNIIETTAKLRRIAKLFMNERDNLNRPILKRIQFTHYPDEFWEYVMEDSIDAELNITNYACKLTLKIPAGTSYSKDLISTNLTGTNDSLVKVNPIIKLTNLTNDITLQNGADVWSITFPETFKVALDDDNIENDIISISTQDWLEINCKTRKVFLHKYIDENTMRLIPDMEKYCDYGNSWFLLYGDYDFNCIGATVQSINFNERW